jgi:osmotically-inducible protein OsmY
MRNRNIHLAVMFTVLLPLTAGALFAATNEETEKAITATLIEKLGDDAKTIRVAFFDGKATLSGKVTQDSTEEIAKEVALYVPGVTKVENQIESVTNRALGSGKILDESKDTGVEGDVKTALKQEIGAHAGKIEVEACDGVVSIRGNVPDQARHDLAVAAAKKVKGVTKLIDLLRVAG